MILTGDLKNIFFWLVFIVVFVAGGTLQVLDVITNTATTLGIIALFMILSASNLCLTYRLSASPQFRYLYLYTVVVVVSAFLNKTPILNMFGYFIYILVPVLAISMSERIYQHNLEKFFFNGFLFVALLQLPVVIIQKNLYDELSFLHGFRFAEEDAGFGTFFICDDVALCFVLILIIFAILFRTTHLKYKVPTVLALSLTILVSSSKLSKLVLAILFLYFIIFKYVKYKKVLCSAILLFSIIGVSITDFSTFTSLGILDDHLKYERKEFEGAASLPRFAPVIIFLNQPIKWVGEGPYDFYNPISKNWRYGSGHSQILWAYNDTGIIGTLVIIAFFYIVACSRKVCNPHYKLLFFIACCYSLVTTTMSDISIMFSYVFFVNFGKGD